MAEHWADRYAELIVRRKGEKKLYVCASGITPSGTVHIGNFREIISVDLVVRALRDAGKTVRFIYSWDDFDVFRKVPANMPNREGLAAYLRRPIVHVPDPRGNESSYARANEREIERVLHRVGIDPEYIYQSEMYAKGVYAEGVRTALEAKDRIRSILNKHRSAPLPSDWTPVSVFCASCDRDTTSVEGWDSAWSVSYTCQSCGHSETVDLRHATGVKLLWRVDWPMRWKYENVDFEPAGKEHHSAGGSFDTAQEIVREVYGVDPPVTFKYDFISIKGMGGKISSSLGNVVSVEDVLSVYQPEVVRYLFAGTRPDSEFAVSFDLDVIKIYEDYDRCERAYFGAEEIGEKKRARQRRVYELSQIGGVPERLPPNVSFRHLCNLLQIYDGAIDPALSAALPDGIDLDACDDDARRRLRTRAECAWNWIRNHAPEDFRFSIRPPDSEPPALSAEERDAVSRLAGAIESRFEEFSEQSLGELFYEIAQQAGLEPQQLFQTIYRVLLGKPKGPRLASFILTAGRDRILPILDQCRRNL